MPVFRIRKRVKDHRFEAPDFVALFDGYESFGKRVVTLKQLLLLVASPEDGISLGRK